MTRVKKLILLVGPPGSGKSTLAKDYVREGIVIKAMNDYSVEGNKKAVKAINPFYLDNKENTDYH